MEKEKDFKLYAVIRIAAGIIIVLAIIWFINLFFGSSEKKASHAQKNLNRQIKQDIFEKNLHNKVKNNRHSLAEEEPAPHENFQQDDLHIVRSVPIGGEHEIEKSGVNKDEKLDNEKSGSHSQQHESKEPFYKTRGISHPEVTGWSFVEAAIAPLSYELYERSLGWRPNDLIQFTDNINNFQRGVLEVTRKTAVKLAEDISRTGSTASFNRHLENAMNWFMIRPEKFWFPSAEGKYKKGLEELRIYQNQLLKREANFYNRSDNIIPLLNTFRNLLGSCDDNLVKRFEDDGTKVSFFKADDYFFYAKGVAMAMSNILKAIEHDFNPLLKNRNGLGSIHHAIHALEEAEEIDPFIILNHNLSGIFANHRSNLATAISHARFYIGVLIITLST
ncbi:MAG: hypothetical protein CSB21_02630 [Deltaproteobacteria bacterium]|nr:MAG: hypothetical protein CSB21_02630 [Deltaproteobacteria bacterium]